MTIRYEFMMMLSLSMSLSGQWVSFAHKKLTENEQVESYKDNCYVYRKDAVPLFTQLLLSWNSLRPTKGHLVFYVQVRNAHTQKWGSWHRMLEWGNGIQRSHTSRSDGVSKYVHVRLETEPCHFADAFAIKVVGAKGAPLSHLKSVAVTTVNMRDFCSELYATSLYSLSSVFVDRVPKISQMSLDHPDNHRICSPVSCAMLTHFIKKKNIDPLRFASGCYDKGLDSYGSWPFNMAYAYEQCCGKSWFYNTRLNSFKDIHTILNQGTPVVVSIRGTLSGAPQSFPHGHLLIVTGYDKSTRTVICHDPSKKGHGEVEQRYSLDDFIRSWEASRRLAYIAERI